MDRIEEMIQHLELLRMHFGDITKLVWQMES